MKVYSSLYYKAMYNVEEMCIFIHSPKRSPFYCKIFPEGHRTFCVSTISNSPLHLRTVKQKCLRRSSQFIQSTRHMG